MKFETPGIDAGEKTRTKPRNDNRERSEAGSKERDQKSPPLMETPLQQFVIALAKTLKSLFEFLLHPDERVSADGSVRTYFLSAQQILRHRGNDCPRQEVRSKHGKDNRFAKRKKKKRG